MLHSKKNLGNPPPGQGQDAQFGISRDIKELSAGKFGTVASQVEKSGMGMFG